MAAKRKILWWAVIDGWNEFPPVIKPTKKEAEDKAWHYSDAYDSPGRFAVKRVELRKA